MDCYLLKIKLYLCLFIVLQVHTVTFLMLIGQYYYLMLNWVTLVSCNKNNKHGRHFGYGLTFQTKTIFLRHYEGILLVRLLRQNQNYQLILGWAWNWSLMSWLTALMTLPSCGRLRFTPDQSDQSLPKVHC